MKRLKRKNFIIIGGIILVFAIIIFIIIATMDKNMKIGFTGSKTSNEMTASFQYFNGTEDKKLNLAEGEKLSVAYELQVSKGVLTINILDEEGNILESRKDEKGIIELNAKSSQKYSIKIIGDKSKGSYAISWNSSNN